MKAITEPQPHATFIALGVQTILTRSWSTNYRGPLAIHASERWEKGWCGVWVDPWSDRPADAEKVWRYDLMVETLGCHPVEDINGSECWTTDCRNIPLGAVVATCTLTDCVPIPLGDFTSGRFAFLLDDVRPVDPPVPTKGQARLWNWESPTDKERP